MNTHQRKRLYWIALLLLGVTAGIGIIVYALQQNMNLYFTPQQVQQQEVPEGARFRMGGLVVPGSVVRNKDNLTVRFMLSDLKANAQVHYTGILPDLFREGQGVVVLGHLEPDGRFLAEEVLAKHDESYMPPEVKAALNAP